MESAVGSVADTLSPKIDVAESKDAIDMTAELSGVDETNG
jgi:HSP20 family molecular chaperone IbpA